MDAANSKIQIYLDTQTNKKIKEEAEENAMSVSKYVARILENHVENASKNDLFQIKTQAMLAQILSSVYDYDTVHVNAKEVKMLMTEIEKRARDRVKKSRSDKKTS